MKTEEAGRRLGQGQVLCIFLSSFFRVFIYQVFLFKLTLLIKYTKVIYAQINNEMRF